MNVHQTICRQERRIQMFEKEREEQRQREYRRQEKRERETEEYLKKQRVSTACKVV